MQPVVLLANYSIDEIDRNSPRFRLNDVCGNHVYDFFITILLIMFAFYADLALVIPRYRKKLIKAKLIDRIGGETLKANKQPIISKEKYLFLK